MANANANIVMKPNECLGTFNQKHCVVLHGSKVVVTVETYDPTLAKTIVRFLRPIEFRNLYENTFVKVGQNEIIPAADWWLGHSRRRAAQGVVFDPENKHTQYFNLWKGFSVQPGEGDCTRFLEFLREVICQGDDESFAYLIGYFAHLVQRPWELPEAAIVIVGEQGTGKSFAVKQFARLVSQHSTTVSQRKQFVGGFNAYMANTILMIGDEVSIATRFATNAIKAPITEPTIMLEAKGLDAVPIRNCVRYVLITNDQHVALMDARERRFAVFNASTAHQQDNDYFAKLSAYMDNGDLAALMSYLLRYDLSNFNVRRVPRTKAFARQVEQSFDTFDRWLYERLQAGEIPSNGGEWRGTVPRFVLTDDYNSYCDGNRLKGSRSRETEFGKRLRGIFRDLGDTRIAKVRNYILPDLDNARKAFDAYSGINWDWEE